MSLKKLLRQFDLVVMCLALLALTITLHHITYRIHCVTTVNDKHDNSVTDSNLTSLVARAEKTSGHPKTSTTATHQEDNSTTHYPSRVLRPCPYTSPLLKGPLRVSQRFHPPNYLERLLYFTSNPHFPTISLGGHYKPTTCQAQQRVAIIIPYRNRYRHLHILLYNLIPVLRRQQADFRFFVIEQDLPTTFNRGMLLNIGFLEALKCDNFDCFIFSDVDLLPLDDRNLYRCREDSPIHLVSGVSKRNYRLPYDNYYGGIAAFSKKQYETINGNSNLYFGWGMEDDELLVRVMKKGFKLMRPPQPIGLFEMINHTRDKGNARNKDRRRLLYKSYRQDLEGLNTTVYSRSRMEILPLYTWIHVFINMTQVLQTAPREVRTILKWLPEEAKRFDQIGT